MLNFIVSSSLSYSFYLNSYSAIQSAVHDISYSRIAEMSASETEQPVILLLSQIVLQHATTKQTRIPNWIRSVNVNTVTSFSLKTAQYNVMNFWKRRRRWNNAELELAELEQKLQDLVRKYWYIWYIDWINSEKYTTTSTVEVVEKYMK